MKKIMMSAAVLALLATGCQNEVLVEQSQPQEGQLFTLEVGRGFESRTVLGETDANGKTPTWWSEDDAIYVSGADGKVSGILKFVRHGSDKSIATFSGLISGGKPSELKHIVFPVPEGGKTINMADRTPGKLDAPMIGILENGVVKSIKNIGGIIAFKSDKAYDVRAMNGNANMAAGTYTFDPTTGKLDYEPGTLTDVTPTYNPDGSPLVYVPVATTTDPTDGTNTTALAGVTIDALQNGAVISSATVTVTPNKIVGDDNTELTLPAIDVWDGTIATPVEKDNIIEINSAAELAGLAVMVNNGTTLEGKTVNLMTNIDLNGKAWTPIGTGLGTETSKAFKGTFNGNRKTITNLYVNTKDEVGQMPAGLFGYVSYNATISNLKICNVNIIAKNYAGAVAGYFQSYVKKNVNVRSVIEDCDVEGGIITVVVSEIGKNADGTPKYDYGDNAGGIAGYTCYASTINACSVKRIKIEGYRRLGGITGHANSAKLVSGNKTYKYELKLESCTVTDTEIHQNLKNGYKDNKPTTLDAIAGEMTQNGTLTMNNNNSSTVNIYLAE